MLLPKTSTGFLGAEAIDLSGWLMKGLRQVSGTPKRDCAATRNSSVGDGVDRKGAPSPNELQKTAVCREHRGYAPLVCRGEAAGASLEALGAEALDIV